MPKLEDNLSKKEIDNIIELYLNNTSLREIERITSHSRHAVGKMLESMGIKKTQGNHYRQYFFDFDFFETIDSELKAYWLGFLYADGCILSKRDYGEQEFKLQIAESDLEILEHFKKDLNSTYPIRKDESKNKKNPNHQVQVLLSQRSQKTVDDLKRLGCYENKSLTLNFPTEEQVPSKYIYDFIRGYFDGDGSILSYKGGYIISIVGTENFIKKLSTYFQGGSIFPDKRKVNSWYFSLGGNLQVMKAYHLMYDNKTRYLKRKYEKFQILLNKYNESQGIQVRC